MTTHYEYGPEGMPRVRRMPEQVLDCLIRDSPYRFISSNEEDLQRLYALLHAVAEETLARVPAWPAERTTSPVMTEKPDTSQDWAKLDGATAFHLIERHAEDWAETGHMMESWLAARIAAAAPHAQAPAAPTGAAEAKLAEWDRIVEVSLAADYMNRATAAEAQLDAIREGIKLLQQYWVWDGHLCETQNQHPERAVVRLDKVLAILQQQPQADESGLPG